MRRVDVNRVTHIGAAGGGPASVLLRCMTTQGFSNPLPDDTGHGKDDSPAAPATAHPAPPLVDPSSFPRGTSPNTKHTVREQHKWQETIASFDAPSQSSLKRTFHHQYLPNTSPEIPNYVVDESKERSGHGMLTARNANLATPGHSRGATLGDWLKSTRGAPLARPHIPSSSTSTPIPSTNPHLAAAHVGDDHKHPSMIHPGLQRKRLEEEKAAYDLAVEESTKDALVQHEQQQGSVTGGGDPRLVVQHRDFRGEVIRAATEEFYDPETGGLKANTGSATASEQAMRARIFDGNAGFAFKTSGGSTSGGAGSVMVKNMVLDRGIEEEIIANRRKAALGIGELGIREKVKKMEQAEREYEDELTPEGREVYRKAKLDAAQLAGKVERDEAAAKERRLKALTGDDDNGSFDRLRSASRVAASRLTHQGLDSEYPDVVEGAPPIRESLPRGGGNATLQPQLKHAPSSSKGKTPLPFLAEEEYAYGEDVDAAYTAAQSSSFTDAASAAAATSMSTQHTGATTSFLHQDDLEEDQLATPMDLMSAARATKQYPVATTVPKQFSFHSPNETPLHPKDYLASFDPVPNNTPVPEAPMWTSSLSVPLRARRILGDTWRNPQVSSGEVPEPTVQAFQRWMEDVCPKLKSDQVFSKNIVVKPRQMFTKGLYARRQFKKGDIIATIPVVSYETNADGVQVERSPFGSHMTIESLLRHSTAVRDRNVPSIAAMHPVFVMKTSATRDTEMHPLFEEQLYLAMLVACEKDAADRRRLSNGNNNANHDDGEVTDTREVCAFGPYFDTIAALAVDDEYIREINKESIEPHQGLEYIDHEGRIASYIRRIQKRWPDAPHYDTLLWATRFVLSRQRMLPMRDDFADQRSDANVKVGGSSTTTTTPSPSPSPSILSKGRVDEVWGGGPGQGVLQVEEASLDWLSRFQRWVRETALSAVLPSASVEAAKEARLINDRRVVPTVVPLVDMIMHDFKGVGSVVVEQVKTENLPPSSSPSQTATTTTAANAAGRVVSRGYSFIGDGLMSPEEKAEELRLQASPPSLDTPRDDFTLVVRANRDMQVGEELTMVYPKCYSVSYTLFKYGFLALRPRALDTTVIRQQWGEERGSVTTTNEPSTATSLPKSDAETATLPPPATPAV